LKLVTRRFGKESQSDIIRVPQRFFNPTLVKSECQKERVPALGKSFYRWQNNLFRNGFLYLPIRIASLVYNKVNPRLEEVQRFQL
jgi:transcription elongation factor